MGIIQKCIRERDVAEFMRFLKNALIAIQTLATTSLDILRHALDLLMLEEEKKARGSAVKDMMEEYGKVSVLYASIEKVCPEWVRDDAVNHALC